MRLAAFIASLLIASPALALPAVTEQDAGKQYFTKRGCDTDKDAAFDNCSCAVSFKYQQIEGHDAINEKLAPEKDVRGYCNALMEKTGKDNDADDWKTSEPIDATKAIYQLVSTQQVTFLSDKWLNVLTKNYLYFGGPQGLNHMTSKLYDLETGQEVDILSLINRNKVARANKVIQTQLNAKKGEVHEELLGAKDLVYIDADGKCDGCVYVLRKDGLHVMFQEDTVGPYEAGFVEVALPPSFLIKPLTAKVKAG